MALLIEENGVRVPAGDLEKVKRIAAVFFGEMPAPRTSGEMRENRRIATEAAMTSLRLFRKTFVKA